MKSDYKVYTSLKFYNYWGYNQNYKQAQGINHFEGVEQMTELLH